MKEKIYFAKEKIYEEFCMLLGEISNSKIFYFNLSFSLTLIPNEVDAFYDIS